jgi:hypothetical protein
MSRRYPNGYGAADISAFGSSTRVLSPFEYEN